MALPFEKLEEAKSAALSRNFRAAKLLLYGKLDEKDSQQSKNLLAYTLNQLPERNQYLLEIKALYESGSLIGDSYAQQGLAGILKSQGHLEEAIELMIKSSNGGRSESSYNLFGHYFNLGNKDVAFDYLKAASEQGHAVAKQKFALLLITGKYGKKNIPIGIMKYFSNIPYLIRYARQATKDNLS